MSKTVQLQTPLTDQAVADLRIGDKALINGTIYTARDAAHQRLVALLERGEALPIDLTGQVLYYVGPAPAPPGKPIGSAGPTTSYRMDPYTPQLLGAGLKGMIGKGPRSQTVKAALAAHKAVYFAAVGGAAVVIAAAIKAARVVAYDDLGTEAIRELQVEALPCFVANDIWGGDLYAEAVERYRKPA
jgi:fumarate hydratase subunit beta